MPTREEEMNEVSEQWSKKHPQVTKLFIQFTNEIIDRGFKHYSSKAIFERIRWETDQADVDGNSTFKLSNNHTAWFARKFMERFPEHEGFFRTHYRPSSDKLATGKEELGPNDFQYTTWKTNWIEGREAYHGQRN
jgi:hypothetical protein